MIGERIKRARGASGLSLRSLAEQVGVSHAMIKKYEDNQSMPSSDTLLRIAKTLGVRVEYFFRPATVTLDGIEYRKRADTPQRVIKRIEADVLDQAERWEELANLWPNFPTPLFSLPSHLPSFIANIEEVDAFADALRDVWQLGFNPLPDLVETLESKGVLVIITTVDSENKFDGLQASVNGKPVLVVSANWPGDRQRFTLAHELGHLVLHGRLPADMDEEKACNRFASAFLMPAQTMRRHLGESRKMLEMQELYHLKHEFGLSMQACLRRASDLGIISDSVCQRLLEVFSKQGWRKQEPGKAYPQENTSLFKQLVFRAHAENIIGEAKAAEFLGLSAMEFHLMRKMELLDAVAS